MNETSTLAMAKRLAHWVKPHRAALLMGTLFSLISAVGTAVWTSLVGPLLKSLLAGGNAQWGPFTLSQESLFFEVPVAIVLVATVKAVSQFASASILASVSQRSMHHFRTSLYETLLAQEVSYFESQHSGSILAHFSSDLGHIEGSFGQALGSVAKDVLQILALLLVCLFIDARLFFIMFIVIPGGAIPVARFARLAKKAAKSSQASVSALSTLAVEATNNSQIVQAFSLEKALLQKFDDEQARYLSAMKRSLFARAAFSPSTEFLGVLGAAAVVAIGSAAIAKEPALASSVLSFLTASLMMYQPVKSLSNTMGQLSVGTEAARRLLKLIDSPPLALTSEAHVAPPLAREIEFKNVSLSFDDGRAALNAISFTVKKGSVVALVGPSGAGKSSVLLLLQRFRRATQGQILWDGKDIEHLSVDSTRGAMAWVSQEPVLFSRSVRENLCWARPGASDAQVWQALELAFAADFVRQLPLQLDEVIGERGGTLSGGQRQRLAIARAFLREPQILLLDEATSALDAESQAEVQKGLDRLKKNRTVLLVAHRLETVKLADEILVFETGHIVERGTFSQLEKASGLFSRLLHAHEPTSRLKETFP
jgi:ATP-binding cassette, subfamily B, bacterial MsbA